MLETNKDNSKVIPESSLIKLIRVNGFVISSLNFKHIIMANYYPLESNKWLSDWFKTQEDTIGD
jgi:hypothetical protein